MAWTKPEWRVIDKNMNRQDIEGDRAVSALLRQSRRAPPLPPGFQEAVWRRIDRAEKGEAEPRRSLFTQLADALLRPRLALAGMSAVLVFGLLAGASAGQGHAMTVARTRYMAVVAPWQVQSLR